MQRLTEKELHGFRSEFEMTCAAQDGDGRAWLILWNQYKTMMMSRLIAAKGFTREELESEAVEVFSQKLAAFNREKVSSEKAYSMHSWLFCAIVNRTDRLIRQRKKEVHLYFEDVSASSSAGEALTKAYGFVQRPIFSSNSEEDFDPLQNQMIGTNDEIYSTYNPEKLIVAELHDNDTERVKNFYAKLSQFQRDVLSARREGLTMSEVAKKFCCSVTTVKNHIKRAKEYANDIFQVCYA